MSPSPFLDPLLPLPAPADDRYIWAKVTQSSPLRIQVDGDRTPLGITPDTLVSGLVVDQRVYCQIINRRLIILGASGGSGVVAATPNTVVLRDAAGRAQVADPVVDADIANRGWVNDDAGDNAVSNNTLARRGASGNLAAATATSGVHLVPKAQMDTALALKVGKVNRVIFTANGTYTKPANLLYADVEVQAGGGGGGSSGTTSAGQCAAGGGGGAGSYSRSVLAASALASTVAVTVGGGGSAGTAGNGGNSGSNSSFGAHVTAVGGNGGAVASATTTFTQALRGAPGNGGTGQLTLRGNPGNNGYVQGSNNLCITGWGGDSPVFGGGAQQAGYNANAGSADANTGGGGSGSGTRTNAGPYTGGAGAAGIVIITEYLSA